MAAADIGKLDLEDVPVVIKEEQAEMQVQMEGAMDQVSQMKPILALN